MCAVLSSVCAVPANKSHCGRNVPPYLPSNQSTAALFVKRNSYAYERDESFLTHFSCHKECEDESNFRVTIFQLTIAIDSLERRCRTRGGETRRKSERGEEREVHCTRGDSTREETKEREREEAKRERRKSAEECDPRTVNSSMCLFIYLFDFAKFQC